MIGFCSVVILWLGQQRAVGTWFEKDLTTYVSAPGRYEVTYPCMSTNIGVIKPATEIN